MLTNSNDAYCFSGLRSLLSHLSGLSAWVEIPCKPTDKMVNKRWVLNGKEIGPLVMEHRKGGIKVFTNKETKTDYPFHTQFDKVYSIQARPLDEFGIAYYSDGEIKYCEGGGWYSMIPVYQVEGYGYYFMPKECYGNCGKNCSTLKP